MPALVFFFNQSHSGRSSSSSSIIGFKQILIFVSDNKFHYSRIGYFVMRQHFDFSCFSFWCFPRYLSWIGSLTTFGVPSPYAVLSAHARKTPDHIFCISFVCCHFHQKIPCFVDDILCDKRDHLGLKWLIFRLFLRRFWLVWSLQRFWLRLVWSLQRFWLRLFCSPLSSNHVFRIWPNFRFLQPTPNLIFRVGIVFRLFLPPFLEPKSQ